MELTNIVYSITLIFFLIFCFIFLVGFLGSQYRKYQLNYSGKKIEDVKRSTKTRGERSTSEFFDRPVIRPLNKITMTNPEYDYSHITYRKVSKNKIKAEPVKKIKRGSLVKENYNMRMQTNNKTGEDKNSIDFN